MRERYPADLAPTGVATFFKAPLAESAAACAGKIAVLIFQHHASRHVQQRRFRRLLQRIIDQSVVVAPVRDCANGLRGAKQHCQA